MIFIEIHGYGHPTSTYGMHADEKAYTLKNAMRSILVEHTWTEEISLTICTDETFNLDGIPCPFIRIFHSSESKEGPKTIELLEQSVKTAINTSIISREIPAR